MDASFDFVRRIVPETSTSFMVPSAATSPLLDLLSATTLVAYSTRKLRAAYAGSAIRVKRSSDSAEQDIGFDGSGNLDTAALSSFVGANDGAVVTWYDQSTNANNASKDAGHAAPFAVTSGVVETVNGKPAIRYATGVLAANTILILTGSASQPFSYCIVVRQTSFVTNAHICDGFTASPRNLISTHDGLSFQMFAGGGSGISGGSPSTDTTYGIVGVLNSAGTSEIFVNNSSVVSSSGVLGSDAFGSEVIGSGTGGTPAINGFIPEFIILDGIVSSGDRSVMASSWASYWGTT